MHRGMKSNPGFISVSSSGAGIEGTPAVTSKDVVLFQMGDSSVIYYQIRAHNQSNLGPKDFLFLSGILISLRNKQWLQLFLWKLLFS